MPIPKAVVAQTTRNRPARKARDRDRRRTPPPAPQPRYVLPRGASALYTNSTSNVVKIAGMPAGIAPDEVLKFFAGYEVKEGSLKVDVARGSSSAGMIKFVNAKEAARAVKELDRTYMGSRWVMLTML